jgi:peptide/nickel transport system substrate-binding protein
MVMVPAARMLLLCTLVLGCANPASMSSDRASGSEPAGRPATAPKSIAIALDEDMRNVWNVVTEGSAGSESKNLVHAFHQPLAANVADGGAVPRVLQELPSIERGTWKVFPDGTMETTLRLRSGVRWHDGTPITARDVLFSYEVFRDPELPNSAQEVVGHIPGMHIVDTTTVLVRWSAPYPFADRLESNELLLLPAHLLEETYLESKSRLLALPYFSSSDYMGLGPYRIAVWERASHLDLTANPDYFLGRPKIDRIRVQFIPDGNTMLANLKAGTVQFTLGWKKLDRDAMRLLEKEWQASGAGTVIVFPRNYKFGEPQKFHNPQPSDLMDVRVRRALLHAIDREEVARAVYEERGIVADSWVHPTFKRYPQVQDVITRYPYDVRRAGALLEEVGWRRGADAGLQKEGQRFHLALRDVEGGEKLALMVGEYWKPLGITSTFEYQSPAQMQDRQARATFSGMLFTNIGVVTKTLARRIASEAIPTAENRWTGSNRGGYANPQWDELAGRILTTLDEGDRLEIERQMLRLYTTELPLLPLLYTFDELPVGGGLTGLLPNTGVPENSSIVLTWNIHEWDIPARP